MNAGINLSALASYRISNEEIEEDLSRDIPFSETSSNQLFGLGHNNFSASLLNKQRMSTFDYIKQKNLA